MIGRYRILGHLATGGMAEIFLASSVDRPVVIKRVLPHLARHPSFVSMFLDEARLTSQIDHPNVVEVFELGQVHNDLFLVMEYLQGESVSSLVRRLIARGRRLDYRLIAHIFGEVCAGLHAAHELKDELGRKIGVVHRDLSGQNIFVTYSGDVKILDFGVALARDRLGHTATGSLKGSIGYMSPEQCRGETLDLRSDLFSLGAVVYELSTLRKLFVRKTEMLTMKAICEGEIPPPSRKLADYPPKLERIVLRALSRPMQGRFGSADAMGAALRSVAGTERAHDDFRAELAADMQQLFADRIDEKRSLLSSAQDSRAVSYLPLAEADVSVEVPLASGVRSDVTAPLAPRKRRWIAVVAAVAALGALGAAGFVVMSADTPERPAEPPAEPPEPVSTAAPPGPTEPAPAETVDTVSIEVRTSPPGAQIHIAGELVGTTPTQLELDKTDGEITMSLELAGHDPVEETVVLDKSQRLVIRLVRSAPARASSDRPAARRPRRSRGNRAKATEKSGFHRFD